MATEQREFEGDGWRVIVRISAGVTCSQALSVALEGAKRFEVLEGVSLLRRRSCLPEVPMQTLVLNIHLDDKRFAKLRAYAATREGFYKSAAFDALVGIAHGWAKEHIFARIDALPEVAAEDVTGKKPRSRR